MRNDLTAAERDLLTEELMNSVTSRVYVAVSQGPPLDVWAALKTAALVAHALTGEQLTLPGAAISAPAETSPDVSEVEAARARLRRHSVIADLPEE